jgi:lysophospholipase L1-like esterase
VGVLCAASFTPAQAQGGARGGAASRWVTAWATSQQTLGEAQITNATVRMIARVTIPGSAIRVRLDNTFGTEPVTIRRASVGHRVRGALVAGGSIRPVTFSGAAEGVIPVGGTLTSDPVALAVFAQQDLAVSLFIPGANVRPSQHSGALVTSYRTADGGGDATTVEGAMPFGMTTTAMWWLKAVDVQPTTMVGTIVAFGDSITDGTCATLDAHDRWENILSLRLALAHDGLARGGRPGSGYKAVINEGIGGNTVTREGLTPPPDSPPGLERLDRDVLTHHGVSDVVLFMGTNDIRRGVTAANLIAGMNTIIQRVKAKNIRIVGATIIPRHNVPASGTNTGWDEGKTRIRRDVNQWIRAKAPFDGVLDFDQVVRDPANPDLMLPPFNCGDGIHPSVLGYNHMGRSIDLGLFNRR